jgi:hypothetical protein
MAKRDSKGRFKRKGMGTIITVRRGMGALPGGAMGEAIIPPAVGGIVTALVTLAIRQMISPTQGPTQGTLVRYAPWFGALGGVVASLALMLLGGSRAAISGAIATLGVTLGLAGQDMILRQRGAEVLAALPPPSTATTGTAGYGRRLGRGAGAIVPEYSRRPGMGAMVLEPVGPSGKRAGTLGRSRDYGEVVSLQGLNVGAFGTPGFRA